MKTPDERLISVLSTIEIGSAIAIIQYPRLVDKDFEYVYAQFHKFFKSEVQGGSVPEPESTIEKRDQTIDLIFQMLNQAEDEEKFNDLIDGSFAPAGRPITIVEELYVIAFNYLKRSVKLWRTNAGPKGYINGPLADFDIDFEEDTDDIF